MTRKQISNVNSKGLVIQRLPLTVCYDKSIEDLVMEDEMACDPRLGINNQNFKTTRVGTIDTEVTLMYFGKKISSDEVINCFNKQDLRPAEAHEIISFGKQHGRILVHNILTNVQKVVVALSKSHVFRRDECICLGWNPIRLKKFAQLDAWNGEWSEWNPEEYHYRYYMFLALPK